MESLRELFEEPLKNVYFADKLTLRSLPKLAKKVNSSALRKGCLECTEKTEGQIERLDQIFERHGKEAKAKRGAAVVGLMAQAEELMEVVEGSPIRDAGLLASAQGIEPYEIARYGSLNNWAEKMGEYKIESLLEEILEEEKDADLKISEINMEADTGLRDEIWAKMAKSAGRITKIQ